MAHSPAQRHRIRTLAALPGSGDPARVVGGIAGQMLAKLTQDARRLHDIQSIERKIEVKRTLLPDYQDYLDGVLQGDSGAPDEVLATVMLWHLDAGWYERGLELADYLARHQLALPERYKRNLATLLLDEVAGAIAADAVADPERAVALLQRVAVLVEGQDAPDQARAKLHFALGKTLAAQADAASSYSAPGDYLMQLRTAAAQLKRAVALHSAIGAKKRIEQLERHIKHAEKSG